MGLIDSRMRRVNDHKHLGRKVRALPIKNDAGDLDLIDQVGMLLAEEVQSGQTMLTIDDEEFTLRFADKAHRLRRLRPFKAKGLVGEEQNRPRDQRLSHGGLVEI